MSKLPGTHVFTKDEIKKKICELKQKGWIELPSNRAFRDGGPGNYIEDYLQIKENNLQIADLGVHELKTHREDSDSLNTLKNIEPGPGSRDGLITPLVQQFGFPHNEHQCHLRRNGKKCTHKHLQPDDRCYPIDELSLNGVDMCGKDAKNIPNPRGFYIKVNKKEKKVEMHFDPLRVKHDKVEPDWLENIKRRKGNLDDLPENHYWSFDKIEPLIRKKIQNVVFIKCAEKKESDKHKIKITEAYFLEDFDFEKFLDGIEKGEVYIETRAHGTRNHGTAFRMFERYYPSIFDTKESID